MARPSIAPIGPPINPPIADPAACNTKVAIVSPHPFNREI
jgi:hypothetical protein